MIHITKEEVLERMNDFEDFDPTDYKELRKIDDLLSQTVKWIDTIVAANSKDGILTLFREVRVRKESDLDLECLGRAWTHVRAYARSIYHDDDMLVSVILEGQVKLNDVDWVLTAAKHIIFDLFEHKREGEITLQANVPVRIVRVNNKSADIIGSSGPSEEHWEYGCKSDNPPNAERHYRALMKWFGDSKVIDTNGPAVPRVVYHGTSIDGTTFDTPKGQLPKGAFAVFDKSRLGEVQDSSDSREGFWFTSSEARAEVAAADAEQIRGGSAYVYGVYLRITNPMVLKNVADYDPAEIAKIARKARKQGHDGLIFTKGEMGGSDYLVFEPTQIKSIHAHDFDAADPDIRSNPVSNDALEYLIPLAAIVYESGMHPMIYALNANAWSVSDGGEPFDPTAYFDNLFTTAMAAAAAEQGLTFDEMKERLDGPEFSERLRLEMAKLKPPSKETLKKVEQWSKKAEKFREEYEAKQQADHERKVEREEQKRVERRKGFNPASGDSLAKAAQLLKRAANHGDVESPTQSQRVAMIERHIAAAAKYADAVTAYINEGNDAEAARNMDNIVFHERSAEIIASGQPFRLRDLHTSETKFYSMIDRAPAAAYWKHRGIKR